MDSFSIDSAVTSTPQKPDNQIQPRIDDTFLNVTAYKKGGSKEGKVTNSIIYFVTVDDLPLSTTEKKGFQHLMKTICPSYSVPSRNTITRLIDSKYEIISNILKEKLYNIQNYCLTTDVWTDVMNTRSYLGLTCHFFEEGSLKSIAIGIQVLDDNHSSYYLQNIIKTLCVDWKIESNKIVAILTDNGANIVKAVHDFVGKNKHLPCFAHTLNLVIQKAVEETRSLDAIIGKVKNIVTFFKHSVSAHDELVKLQKNSDKSPKILVQEVTTRWNSKLYMLQRFIELSDFISTILLQKPKAPTMLTGTEIAIVKEIINIMMPIEQVTKELSGQEYVTSSIVIPLISCMTKAIESTNMEETSDISSELKAKTLNEIQKRFKNVEKVHILAISTILDPRFKKIYFSDALSCAKAISDITDLIGTGSNARSTSSSSQGECIVDTDTSSGIWQFHKQMVNDANKRLPDNSQEMGDIMKQYLREPLMDRKSDPFLYWSTRSAVWPDLTKLALQYLSVVATSVPSERLFSSANNTLTENRNRLDPERLSKLLFLKSLDDKYWQL